MSDEASTSTPPVPETTEYPADPAILNKIATAKQYKDTADAAFKNGDMKAALQSYHFSLMYLEGLDKNTMKSMGMVKPAPPPKEGETPDPSKEKTEVDEIIEKIYSNQSAAHIKLGNWDRAIQAAEKALKKNENNHKATFRKAKALGEQGFFEKCVKVFDELKKKTPEDAASIDAEVARLRILDKEREKKHTKKMKGFLSKEWTSEKKDGASKDEGEVVQSGIEEVTDE
ncbi:hypothetical protein DL96DRAFT_1607710 [Flagelloscypha sp. PMI_526]|nr:hypothetical protein DL96DRAFT_1607710 [Flagelloscypha sp. PMI_526]